MNELWCVWLPDGHDVYRVEELNRPPEEARVWTTRALGEAEAKAGHFGGRVVRVDVMKRNYEALRRGALRVAASFCAPPIERDTDFATDPVRHASNAEMRTPMRPPRTARSASLVG